jgi:hypothetical protein
MGGSRDGGQGWWVSVFGEEAGRRREVHGGRGVAYAYVIERRVTVLGVYF